MRVVYVSTLERGGPVSHLRQLAPAVAALGPGVRVVCPSEAAADGFRANGLDTVVAPIAHKLDVRGASQLWGVFEDADVVHTHDRRAGLFARPQARARRSATVHTLHGLPEEIAPRLGRDDEPVPPGVSRLKLEWLLRGYPRIEAALTALGTAVAPSEAMADFLRGAGVAERRIAVIPYGVSLREPARRNAGPFTLAVASNLEHWKGIDVLLDACARSESKPRLEVYGDGMLRGDLERQARDLGVAATFHGFVPDFPDRLDGVDVYVQPSRADNLPISVLEAMAAGVPVIGTRVGGVPEEVADGVTGLVVEVDDAPALAAAIDRLATDPEFRSTLGAAGADRVAERFSADGVARRMVDLYERLCASST